MKYLQIKVFTYKAITEKLQESEQLCGEALSFWQKKLQKEKTISENFRKQLDSTDLDCCLYNLHSVVYLINKLVTEVPLKYRCCDMKLNKCRILYGKCARTVLTHELVTLPTRA